MKRKTHAGARGWRCVASWEDANGFRCGTIFTQCHNHATLEAITNKDSTDKPGGPKTPKRHGTLKIGGLLHEDVEESKCAQNCSFL